MHAKQKILKKSAKDILRVGLEEKKHQLKTTKLYKLNAVNPMQCESDFRKKSRITGKNCDNHSPSGLITNNGFNGIRGCPSAAWKAALKRDEFD